MKQFRVILAAVWCSAAGCKTDPPAAPTPPPVATPTPVASPTPVPPPPPAPITAQPSGPRSEIADPRYKLAVELTPGAAATDPARFTLELRGQGGYHVNDQYPIAIDLTPEQASAEKTALRRADAAEITQAVARFNTPVRAAGEHPTVRGRVRFAVCTEAQCAFETREFAVAL